MTQPWATEVALGHKRVETRTWRATCMVGCELAIHAALGVPRFALEFAREENLIGRIPEKLPLGVVVATATVERFVRTEEAEGLVSGLERHLGDYTWGRWAWFLKDVVALPEPVPCKGALGLWTLPSEVEERVRAQVRGCGKSDGSDGLDGSGAEKRI